MTFLVALMVFVTLTAGIYLALSRDVFRCVIGLTVLGAAANLVLFAAGRLGSGQPAVIPVGELELTDAANPLPQALVLTAIVIGFALVCFALVLLARLVGDIGTDDSLDLRQAEPVPDDPVKPPSPLPECDVRWPPRKSPP